VSYCTRNEIDVHPAQNPDKDAILKAFLGGYIMNTAFLQLDGSYRTCFSHHVSHLMPLSDCRLSPFIHPACYSAPAIQRKLKRLCTTNWCVQSSYDMLTKGSNIKELRAWSKCDRRGMVSGCSPRSCGLEHKYPVYNSRLRSLSEGISQGIETLFKFRTTIHIH